MRRRTQLSVSIPPGVEDGQKIRLAGQGGPGRNGGAAGDLLITVRVQSHPIFERKNRNLEYELPISIMEAMFGAEVEVPTLEGSVRLKVPPKSQSGQKLRIRGKGVPGRKGIAAGDLYVRLAVVVPDTDTPEARTLAEALDKLYRGDIREKLRTEVKS